jgi:hypothetical protein
MSTLSVQAPSRPKLLSSAYAAFARVADSTMMVFEGIAEARRLATEARKRYSYLEME